MRPHQGVGLGVGEGVGDGVAQMVPSPEVPNLLWQTAQDGPGPVENLPFGHSTQ